MDGPDYTKHELSDDMKKASQIMGLDLVKVEPSGKRVDIVTPFFKQKSKNIKTELFLGDTSNIDLKYQNWLDENPNIDIISTALSQRSDQLVFIITYK